MARSRQNARKPKAKNRNKNTEQGENNQQAAYDIIIKENEMFAKYYKQLNIMDESEFEEFLNVLRQPLPITFRITSYKATLKRL